MSSICKNCETKNEDSCCHIDGCNSCWDCTCPSCSRCKLTHCCCSDGEESDDESE